MPVITKPACNFSTQWQQPRQQLHLAFSVANPPCCETSGRSGRLASSLEIQGVGVFGCKGAMGVKLEKVMAERLCSQMRKIGTCSTTLVQQTRLVGISGSGLWSLWHFGLVFLHGFNAKRSPDTTEHRRQLRSGIDKVGFQDWGRRLSRWLNRFVEVSGSSAFFHGVKKSNKRKTPWNPQDFNAEQSLSLPKP